MLKLYVQLETIYVLEGLGPPKDHASGTKSFNDQVRRPLPFCCMQLWFGCSALILNTQKVTVMATIGSDACSIHSAAGEAQGRASLAAGCTWLHFSEDMPGCR